MKEQGVKNAKIVSVQKVSVRRVQHNITGTSHDFVVYHNVSRKFSDFLAECARVMGEAMSLKLQVLNVDSKILSIKIEEMIGE